MGRSLYSDHPSSFVPVPSNPQWPWKGFLACVSKLVCLKMTFGDKVLVDIYKLKQSLYDINTRASMYSYIDGLIRENNFVIMNLPSYVNFYNVQEAQKNSKPRLDNTSVFANNLFDE